MATAVLSDVLVPESISQWKETARKNEVLGTINQLGSQVKVGSASKFHFKHFLGLRVLYKFEKKHGRSSLPTGIAEQFLVPAKMALNKTSYWKKYLKEIQGFAGSQAGVAASCIPENLGPLVNVWLYQKHIILGDNDYADMSKVSKVSPVADRTRSRLELRALTMMTPTPASKSQRLPQMMKNASLSDRETEDVFEELLDEEVDEEARDDGSDESSDPNAPDNPHDDDFVTPGRNAKGQPIKDEQTVNVFIIAFLSAITATTVPFHTRWLAERNAMVYQKKVRFVARTDGHLRDRAGHTHSLIEVKPRQRKEGAVAIRMQESAQMAAWLTENGVESHDPHEECR